jgi:hypothetical protein
MAVPAPTRIIPKNTAPSATAKLDGGVIKFRVDCNVIANIKAFEKVPNPGFSFSGIQIRRTRQLTIKKAHPNEIPVLRDIP